MDRLINHSLKDYIAVLGDEVPAPGGGSAAAAVLCCSIALYRKCLLYSSSNFKKESFDDLKISLSNNIDESLSLIDKDKELYLSLSELIKNKDSSLVELQRGYLDAASAPLEIVKIAVATLDLIDSSLTKIKRGFLSDIIAAISFLEAAFDSALIFVGINLKSINKSFEDFSGFKEEDIGKVKSDFKRMKKGLRDE